tara:strand:- start:140 stop:580 length:441 start_codon:yes stop_codon:yes gene_type:complete
MSGSSKVNVVFRGLFNTLLQYKYDFYQNENSHAQVKSAGMSTSYSEDDGQNVQVASSEDDEDRNKLSKKHGPKFVIIFCCSLILFYIIVSVIAHCAYREFKGVAEDCAGGSINLTDGNILYYGIIAKREQDAIDEKKDLEERARKR